MNPYNKIPSSAFSNVHLKVIPGHFVTPNSHINSYIDMTTMKTRISEARAAAEALSEKYAAGTIVDTLICMDNTEVIGAFLAEAMLSSGVKTNNTHQTIYCLTPEYDTYGQLIFRDNVRHMLMDKYVLLLLASTTTGKTVSRALEAIRTLGGIAVGASAIFSTTQEIGGTPIFALFTESDVPGYETHAAADCELCKRGVPIDAICNGFGYTEVNR